MELDSQAAPDAPARANQASGQAKHHWRFRRPPLPRIRLIGKTAPNRALVALWPWSVADYPGILKGARELFQSRVKPDTIKKWRQGKHKPPQWALDLLTVALKQRRNEIDHALALLTKEKGR